MTATSQNLAGLHEQRKIIHGGNAEKDLPQRDGGSIDTSPVGGSASSRVSAVSDVFGALQRGFLRSGVNHNPPVTRALPTLTNITLREAKGAAAHCSHHVDYSLTPSRVSIDKTKGRAQPPRLSVGKAKSRKEESAESAYVTKTIPVPGLPTPSARRKSLQVTVQSMERTPGNWYSHDEKHNSATPLRTSNSADAVKVSASNSVRLNSPSSHTPSSVTYSLSRLSRVTVRTRTSLPDDSSELEARNIAKLIMREPEAVMGNLSFDAASSASPANPSGYNALAMPSRMSAGTQLPSTVFSFMQTRFGVNLGHVRIHTDPQSAQLAQDLDARAFTVGSHIFFGKDQFQPHTIAGQELIAHEIAHTFQQGATIRRSEQEGSTNSSGSEEERGGLVGRALSYIAEQANLIPGFRMFTIILGVNPVNMSRVERSPANILRALVEFIPGGALITQALDNHGVFDKVANWVGQQIETLGLVGSSIKQALSSFLDSLSWSDLLHPGDVWERAKRIFTEPIDRIINFAKGLVTDIIKFIKDAILMPIARLAEGTRGWDLLIAVLGKNPITGEEVPRNAETLIGGFMKLIGEEEVWENMKKANAVGRAWAWFQGAMGALLGFVQQIPTLAKNAFEALTLEDIVLLPKAFEKVGAVFANFIGDFISWAGNAVWNLLEVIFDVVSPGALQYIKRTGAALKSILKNPLPFVGNLVKAAKRGFESFAANFGAHLKKGLIDWLTGSLQGVYIPKGFALGEIVKFIFSILGVSWQIVRQKLVKVVGEPAVKAMETGFDIVVTLVTQGPAAAWDKIKEHLANLKDMVIGGIIDLVVDAVVKKAIPKLIAMFVPGAGFISAIISIYDTIMVFVNKLSQIGQVVVGFVNSIVAIASGDIGGAASRVENILASIMSLAINFLAGFAGLGKVADKILGVVGKVRTMVDKGLDALIGWIVKMAKQLFAKVFGKKDKDDRNNTSEEAERLQRIDAARKELMPLLVAGVPKARINSALLSVKSTYGFKDISVKTNGKGFTIKAKINPSYDVINGKVIDLRTKKEIDLDKLSHERKKNILKSLGLGHAIGGHGPDVSTKDLINIAQSKGVSGKFSSYKAVIDASELAKKAAQEAERRGEPLKPNTAYSVPMPPECFEAYRRKEMPETSTDEPPTDADVGFALEGKPSDKLPEDDLSSLPNNVERVSVTKARFTLTSSEKGRYNIKTIFPPTDTKSDEDVSRYL